MSQRTMNERVEEAPGITEEGLFGPYKFITLKSGNKLVFWDAVRLADSAQTDLSRALSRAFKLANSDWDLEALETRIDDLETYLGALRHYMTEIRGKQTKRERIAILRNVEGRTPEEAALYLKKADELERQLEEESA